MKMLAFLVIGVFLLYFVSANMPISLNTEQVVDKLLAKLSKGLSEKYAMIPVEVGASMPDNKVHYLTLGFSKDKNVTQDEARIMLFQLADEYLKIINQTEELKSSMANYPFDHRNVDISIYFQNKSHLTSQHPFLCVAGFSEGKLSYCTCDDKENVYRYKTCSYENYEEALKKIREAN